MSVILVFVFCFLIIFIIIITIFFGVDPQQKWFLMFKKDILHPNISPAFDSHFKIICSENSSSPIVSQTHTMRRSSHWIHKSSPPPFHISLPQLLPYIIIYIHNLLNEAQLHLLKFLDFNPTNQGREDIPFYEMIRERDRERPRTHQSFSTHL